MVIGKKVKVKKKSQFQLYFVQVNLKISNS